MGNRALLVPCGGMPREIEIDGLADLQRAVGGYIESCAWIFNDEPAVFINEEGKFTCTPNRAVYATAEDEGKITWDDVVIHEGDLLDIIYGDFVCIGMNPEEGENRDITDEEIALVNARFGTPDSVWSGLREAVRIKGDSH